MKTSMGKRWIIVAIVALVALAGGWYFASPWYTLREMRLALDANDAERLSRHVDYAALREDLKADLAAQFANEAAKDQSGFGALGAAIGTAMIGPMVEGFVSPAGLKAAFASTRNKASQPQQSKQQRKAAGALNLDGDVRLKRHGFDEFTVASKSRNRGTMIFKRSGLSWKLSGVDLPLSIPPAGKGSP